jgi:hypothetical protein
MTAISTPISAWIREPVATVPTAKRPLTYAEIVSKPMELPTSKKLKMVAPAGNYMERFKTAKKTELAAMAKDADDKNSKLFYVVLPKPWIDDAIPFATTVKEAAMCYKEAFDDGQCDVHERVSRTVKFALMSCYVASRINWLPWSLAFGHEDFLTSSTGRDVSLDPKSVKDRDHAISADAVMNELAGNERQAYKLNLRYTSLLCNMQQVKMCVVMDFESRNELFPCAPSDLNMNALREALEQYFPDETESGLTRDVASFLSTLQVTELNDGSPGPALYGFIGASNGIRSSDENRVADIIEYVKYTVSQPEFQKRYLIALKKYDEDSLETILEFGSDWARDILTAEVWLEIIYDLQEVFKGFSLYRAGSMIFGSPENWPPYLRKAFAMEGENTKPNSSDDDNDDFSF